MVVVMETRLAPEQLDEDVLGDVLRIRGFARFCEGEADGRAAMMLDCVFHEGT